MKVPMSGFAARTGARTATRILERAERGDYASVLEIVREDADKRALAARRQRETMARTRGVRR